MPCPMGNGPAVFRRLTVRIPRRWSGMRRRDACSTSAQADTHLRLLLEQRELASRAAVQQAARPLLHWLQAELLGVERSRPLQILRGQPRRNATTRKHDRSPPRLPGSPRIQSKDQAGLSNPFADRSEAVSSQATRMRRLCDQFGDEVDSFDPAEGAGDNAARLCLLGSLLERALVQPWDLGGGLEIDLLDRGDPADVAEVDAPGGLDRARRMARLAENKRERHRETGRVCRGE